MHALYLILYVIAAVCFALAALTANSSRQVARRTYLVALGLLAWVLVPLIQTYRQ